MIIASRISRELKDLRIVFVIVRITDVELICGIPRGHSLTEGAVRQ